MTLLASPQDTILIETANVTRESLPNALAILRGCWKSSSILWMRVNGFPALSGLVLRAWSQKSGVAVERFCRERHFSELLVRIEKPSQRWVRRRAGYTIPVLKAQTLVEDLTSEGFMTILLEPASPCADLFSLASVCDVASGKVDIEVVGPGFDASDILRADIKPHERFEIAIHKQSASFHNQEFQISRVYLVDPESYRASVRRRLIKIGARLRNPSFPDELMLPNVPAATLEGLIQDATQFLRESGQTALLDNSELYRPIPERLLDAFLNQVLRLSRAVATSDVSWRIFSLAGSFLPKERLVIWDFFPPGDHDTTTLANLHAPTA